MEKLATVINQIKTSQQGEAQTYPTNDQSALAFKNVVYKFCPGFVITPENIEVLNQLYFYANRNPKGKLNPDKGIFLYGEIGTGKSTLLKILAEYQRLSGRGFKCVNCASIAAYFASHGVDSLNEHTWNETYKGAEPVERGFDELGKETIPAKHYGNELNVMQHVIQLRYDLKIKTHITTNMIPNDIEPNYHSHIFDRAIEMFNFIELKGDSFRK